MLTACIAAPLRAGPPARAGLAGCAALAASYPFTPPRLGVLLGVVVALGSVSAVAFSTSYQLVAWFRCSRGSLDCLSGAALSGAHAACMRLLLHLLLP